LIVKDYWRRFRFQHLCCWFVDMILA